MDIKRLDSLDSDFQLQLDKLLAWDSTSDEAVFKTVSEILKSVKNQGDSAVLDFSLRFDGLKAKNLAELEMPLDRLREAYDGIEPRDREALEQAAARIRAYAEHQKLESWEYTEADGTLLGQQITPLDRVGLYVPGGKAAYPSSVLMNAIPAVVAGVQELIMVVPTPRAVVNELVLAAAHVAGVTRVFTIGGAQATWWLAPLKFWSFATARPIRTGLQWTCFRRPSTMKTPRRSCSLRMVNLSIRWWQVSSA
jgi:histidinol dehydrogenase